MPIVRFSAAEQQGLFVPKTDIALFNDLGRMTMLMVQSGIAPQRMPAGELVDVTPPHWLLHNNTYWVQTEAADPPEHFTGFVMPRLAGAGAYRLRPDGTFEDEPVQTMRVPDETSAFVVISPDRERVALRLHELIMPLPDGLISGIQTMVEQGRTA